MLTFRDRLAGVQPRSEPLGLGMQAPGRQSPRARRAMTASVDLYDRPIPTSKSLAGASFGTLNSGSESGQLGGLLLSHPCAHTEALRLKWDLVNYSKAIPCLESPSDQAYGVDAAGRSLTL